MLEDKINSLKGRKPDILDHEELLKYAVLLPLFKEGSELMILFEKRSRTLDYQPGEVCFPGGRIEDYDCGAENAAIRETCEELGITPKNIEIIAPLDVMVSPFNMLVKPFLAYIEDPSTFNPNPAEVDKVFYAPLNYFLQNEPMLQILKVKLQLPDNYPYHLIPQGRNYPWRQGTFKQYFYRWKEEVIWGLTAYILNNLSKLLQN